MALSIRKFLRRSSGQGLVEYALILALIAVVTIAAMTMMGTGIDSMLSTIVAAL